MRSFKLGHRARRSCAETFGDDVFDEDGEVVRRGARREGVREPLWTRARSTASRCRASRTPSPRPGRRAGAGRTTKAVVVEYSVFKNRETSARLNDADVVIAVLAPHRHAHRARRGRGLGRGPTCAAASPSKIHRRRRASTSRRRGVRRTTAPPRSCATRSRSGGTTTRRAASSWGNRLRFRIHRGLSVRRPLCYAGRSTAIVGCGRPARQVGRGSTMRKNILIIATGGTIASMEDGRGSLRR